MPGSIIVLVTWDANLPHKPLYHSFFAFLTKFIKREAVLSGVFEVRSDCPPLNSVAELVALTANRVINRDLLDSETIGAVLQREKSVICFVSAENMRNIRQFEVFSDTFVVIRTKTTVEKLNIPAFEGFCREKGLKPYKTRKISINFDDSHSEIRKTFLEMAENVEKLLKKYQSNVETESEIDQISLQAASQVNSLSETIANLENRVEMRLFRDEKGYFLLFRLTKRSDFSHCFLYKWSQNAFFPPISVILGDDFTLFPLLDVNWTGGVGWRLWDDRGVELAKPLWVTEREIGGMEAVQIGVSVEEYQRGQNAFLKEKTAEEMREIRRNNGGMDLSRYFMALGRAREVA